MDFLTGFSTLASFAALTVFVTTFVNSTFKVNSDRMKQVASWIVAIVLSVLGLVLQLGMFAGYGTVNEWQAWVMTAVTGLGAGLIANGLYKVPEIHDCLKAIENAIRKKSE